MKINVLNKKIAKRSITSGVIIAFFVGISFSSYLYDSNLIEEKNEISNQIKTIKKKEKKSLSEFDGMTKAIKIYENLPENKKPTKKGYSTPQERIRAINSVISDIKSKYNLNKIDYSFNSDLKKEKGKKNKFVEIYENNISIKFSSLTDEISYAVINHLIDVMPGYIQISKLSLSRLGNNIDNSVKSILEGNVSLGLIETSLNFSWKTLKNKETSKQKKKKK